jgi:hypothetical protein
MNKLWKKIHFLKVFNFFLNEFLSFKKNRSDLRFAL